MMKRAFMVVYKPYKGKDQELLPAVKASYLDLRKGRLCNGTITHVDESVR